MNFLAEFTSGGLLAAVAFFLSRFGVGKIEQRVVRWLLNGVVFVTFWILTVIVSALVGAFLADQSQAQFDAAYTARRVGEAQVGYLMVLIWLFWYSRGTKAKRHSKSVVGPASVEHADWFLQGQTEAIGPFSQKQLMDLLKAGSIRSQTMIWRQGDPEWAPLADRLGLAWRGKPLPLTSRQMTRREDAGQASDRPVPVTSGGKVSVSARLEAKREIDLGRPIRREGGATQIRTSQHGGRPRSLVVLAAVILGLIMVAGVVAWRFPIIGALAQLYFKGNAWAPEEEQYFFKAIAAGDIDSVERLLEVGISANSDSLAGMPPLYLAQMNNRPAVMKALIRHGAELNKKFGPTERTALHDAALAGRIECMRVLLEAGADPNAVNHFGKTPLRFAADPPAPLSAPLNRDEVMQLLRSYGGHE